MQTDMHFYGTYVLARAAGIPQHDSNTIAYSAQFVDDSTKSDSTRHSDGGLLYGIASAHHDKEAIINSKADPDEQRRVWVPFHFLPGGQGESLEEKLLCVKDSEISQEMMSHHIRAAKDKRFGFELLGIAAHVYMDTFSHYGFSGIGSKYNSVDGESFELIDVKDPKMKQYVLDKKGAFLSKYGLRATASFFVETLTNTLGHGGVATYPDRPFLHWRVTFDEPRPGNGKVSDRDNPATFLEGCEKLHSYFTKFANEYYTESKGVEFSAIRSRVEQILRFEGDKADRISQWKNAIGTNSIYPASCCATSLLCVERVVAFIQDCCLLIVNGFDPQGNTPLKLSHGMASCFNSYDRRGGGPPGGPLSYPCRV